MKLRLSNSKENGLVISGEYEEWSQADALVKSIKKRFKGRVVLKAEGPDSRTWEILIAGKKIVIYQWDTYDIELFSQDDADEIKKGFRITGIEICGKC